MGQTNIERLLSLHEGRTSKLYLDTKGIETIGVGRNLRDVGLRSDEIDYLFQNDLSEALEQLDTHLAAFAALDEVRQAVLIDMCFNLGWERLSGFALTLHFISTGNYDGAADEMLRSAWATQVGKRATRLSQMMKTGQWPAEIGATNES
jgi:lysozyme